MLVFKACRSLMVIVTIMVSFAIASEDRIGSDAGLEPQGKDARDLSEPIYVAPAGKVKLVVNHDATPRETSWVLRKGSTVIAKQLTNSVTARNKIVRKMFTLTKGTYTFRIEDSNGDGLCCKYGNGSWGLYTGDANDVLYESNGMFGSNQTKTFELY
jgi:hypothetical protein